jgi:hypothetical protein
MRRRYNQSKISVSEKDTSGGISRVYLCKKICMQLMVLGLDGEAYLTAPFRQLSFTRSVMGFKRNSEPLKIR